MDRIGKYEILDVLGQGGMGVVYRARDPRIGRDVAIKVILDRAIDAPQIRERFYREARSAGALQHENITTIFDVGDEDGKPYLVMELLDGSDLRSVMDEMPPLPARLDLAVQICQGLGYAHGRRIVHRDIKPEDNVRVTSTGRVKILDFGIARIETEEQTMTQASLGTPRYMSPEQIRGGDVDHRTDIFSFGVLFYELLTGISPFAGEHITSVIYKVLNHDPEPIRLPDPVATRDLQAIVAKCLAKTPAKRYSSFQEVIDDIRRARVEPERTGTQPQRTGFLSLFRWNTPAPGLPATPADGTVPWAEARSAPPAYPPPPAADRTERVAPTPTPDADDFTRVLPTPPVPVGATTPADEDLTTRIDPEQIEAERLDAERAEAARLDAERAEAERAEAERLEQERRTAEQAEAARLESERLAAEQAESARLEAERAEAERIAAEKAEAERLETERAEAARVEAAQAEAARLESERLAAEDAERVAAEQAETERIEAERAEAERIEADRIAAEQVEAERRGAEKVEAERLAAEEATARLEAERLAVEQAEAERVAVEQADAERAEAERQAAEQAEAARLETERIDAERAEAARLEAESQALEQQRLEAESQALERQRLEDEARSLEQQRLEAEQAEADRLESERLAAMRAEAAPQEPEQDETTQIGAAALAEAHARAEAEHVDAERDRAEAQQSEAMESATVALGPAAALAAAATLDREASPGEALTEQVPVGLPTPRRPSRPAVREERAPVPAPASPPRSRRPWLIAGGVGLAALAVFVAFAQFDGDDDPPTAIEATTATEALRPLGTGALLTSDSTASDSTALAPVGDVALRQRLAEAERRAVEARQRVVGSRAAAGIAPLFTQAETALTAAARARNDGDGPNALRLFADAQRGFEEAARVLVRQGVEPGPVAALPIERPRTETRPPPPRTETRPPPRTETETPPRTETRPPPPRTETRPPRTETPPPPRTETRPPAAGADVAGATSAASSLAGQFARAVQAKDLGALQGIHSSFSSFARFFETAESIVATASTSNVRAEGAEVVADVALTMNMTLRNGNTATQRMRYRWAFAQSGGAWRLVESRPR